MAIKRQKKLWVPNSTDVAQEVAKSLGTIEVDCDRPNNPDIQWTNCETCKARIAQHCPDCKFQITGCMCTMKKKQQAIKDAQKDSGGLHG